MLYSSGLGWVLFQLSYSEGPGVGRAPEPRRSMFQKSYKVAQACASVGMGVGDCVCWLFGVSFCASLADLRGWFGLSKIINCL